MILPSYNLFRNAKPSNISKIKSYDSKYNPQDTNQYVLIKDLKDSVINEYHNYFDQVDQTLGNEVKNYSNNYYKFFTDIESTQSPLGNDYHLKTKHMFFDHTPKHDKTDYLPFYNSIRLNKEENEEYGMVNILKESGLLMKYIIYAKRNEPEKELYRSAGLDVTVKKWNVELNDDFFSMILEEEGDETFITKKDEVKTINQLKMLPLSEYFDNRLKKYILFKKIQQFKKQKVLSFDEMIINKQSIKKEFVGYKIEKKTSLSGATVQTYYILSHNAHLIDSQIQYDRSYYYKISEFYLAFENVYRYTGGNQFSLDDGNGDPAVDIFFISNVQPKIIEIPIAVLETRVLAPPLFKPDVKIYTNTKEDHKIKFLISDRFGNSTTKENFYTVLNQSDEDYRERLKISRITDTFNRSFFSYKTKTGTYRVYKLQQKPNRYEDFAGAFLGVVGNTTNLDGVPHAIFTDHIKYEQKYYYLFVPISIQGQGGNPSYVQEVQLLKDADENILRYNAYEISPIEQDYVNNSTYRKFIQIVPNYNQTIPKSNLNMEQLKSTQEDPKLLGPDESSLWDFKGNKYIKLRVESKSTGKKFDLNLRFKLKKS